jgi:hypothetical protein
MPFLEIHVNALGCLEDSQSYSNLEIHVKVLGYFEASLENHVNALDSLRLPNLLLLWRFVLMNWNDLRIHNLIYIIFVLKL